MFITVGDSKIINMEEINVLRVGLDISPEHHAYAIYYNERYESRIVAHYPTEAECKEIFKRITTSLSTGAQICDIPAEDPSMFKIIDVTTTSGTTVRFRYAAACQNEFLDQFSIKNKHNTYRIIHPRSPKKLTGKYQDLENAKRDLAGFKEAVKNGLPEYKFTLGNVSGVWYTEDDD